MSRYPRRAFVKVRFMKDSGVGQKPMSKTKTYNHLRYIALRSRETAEEERGLFSAERDHESIESFYERIEEDPALKHKDTYKLHKLVISFRGEDFQRYGVDMKQMTRDFMKALEERKGLKLDWVASVHGNATHPHVHVAIKSVGIDKEGKKRRLKIEIPRKGKKPDRLADVAEERETKTDDVSWMRNEIDRYTGRDRIVAMERELARMERENAKAFRNATQDLMRGLEQVRREHERETLRVQRRFLNRLNRVAAQRQQQRSREEIER